MIRKRDVVAVMMAILLSHLVWNQQESLSATIHLAFYVGQPPSTLVAPMDMDGDGIPETLVQLINNQDDDDTSSSSSWRLKILALPRDRSKTHYPRALPILLESPALDVERRATAVSPPFRPLHMTVGHVLIPFKPLQRATKQDDDNNNTEHQNTSIVDNRTHHYFCGTDWHHASQTCQHPCPAGRSNECPDGQRCFADTPCNSRTLALALALAAQQIEQTTISSRLIDPRNVTRTYALSPVGGLPSVTVLWSNAILTLHSWTAPRKNNNKEKQSESTLQFQTMWTLNLIPEQQSQYHLVAWTESTLQFVDAVDAGNDSGLVIVSATVDVIPQHRPEADTLMAQLATAIHARTGQVVWRSFQVQDNDLEPESDSRRNTPLVLLETRGTSSIARRRSLIPNLHSDASTSSLSLQQEQHCLQSSFRRPLLTSTSSLPGQAALPFVYESQQDASVRVLHFDLEQPTAHNTNKHQANHKDTQGKQQSRRRRRKNTILHGRPNVVVLHNQQGLHVRSLKNGRTLCHLSLNENALYADVNHDGTLDSVQLALGTHALKQQHNDHQEDAADDDMRFITALAHRVADRPWSKTKIDGGPALLQTSLCHLVVLSGFPSREELYSSHLCGGYLSPSSQQELRGVSPLLMESMDGRKGWDILVALNSGVVNRIHGASGRQLWRLKGRRLEHLLEGAPFPHWNDPALALLGRVEAIQTVPPTRPVVLAGENSLVLLSAFTGNLLASTVFPQPSIHRPILVDIDGDGTTDVLVQTKDAIWGFQIFVHTGSSIAIRILTGLLFMGILLAILRNRFGPHPGKRSTDALQ